MAEKHDKEKLAPKQETSLGKGKVASLHRGFELMGSKSTINQKEADIEVFPWGAKVTSKKTKRTFVIYSDNFQGIEMLHDSEVDKVK